MKNKLIKLSFLLLFAVCSVTSAWAADASGANIYYDNTSSNWSDVQLFIGHSSWSSVSSMTKLTNSNNLYYLRSFSWGGYGSFYFTTGASGWDSRGENVDSRVTYTTHYSAKLTNNLSNSTWLFISSGSDNGSSVTASTVTGYDNLNYQQTVQQTLSTDGGSTYSTSTASLATVKVASYYLSSATSTSATATDGTISAGNSSANCKAVRTATVTYTVTSVATGYTFVGWYDGNTQKSTSTTYTYNATAAKTITARFKETRYDVKVATITPSAGGSATPTNWTAMGQVTGGNITATANTGYTFSGWSILSGGGGYFGATGTATTSSTANTKFRPTKSSSLKATFTANTYTITLNGNGGDGGTATVKYDAASLASVSHASRAGYTLNGYYTETSGGSKVISADGSLNNVSGWVTGGYWKKASDETLYAQWTENAVYYILNYTYGTSSTGYVTVSAKNSSTDANIPYGGSVLSGTGITVTATPDTHYQFEGWYSEAACSTLVSHDNPYTFSISGNTNLYAKVVLNTTAITLNRNGGTAGSTSVTATYGSTLPSFTAHTRTGYTLNGYYTNTSGGTKIIDASGVLVASTTYADANKKWKSDDATATFNAQWTEKMTTVTINVSPSGAGTLTVGGSAFTPGNTTTAGVSTSRTVVATAANDYTFSSWSVTSNATGTASTNTYTLKGNGSAGTGTLTANFTLVPCSLMYGGSTPLNSPTSTAMSYDLETGAYYKDVTTNSSPYYFRFSHNDGKQYSGDWNTYPDVNAVSGDGTKVNCNTEVQVWYDKASLKYTGASGSSIRIWFDYQNKKAWVTETTYSVTVSAGSHGSVSPTSVTGVGASITSGDITATPDKGYVFTGWTLPSGTSAAAGYSESSNPIRINATAASKTITANFAAATAFIEGRFHVTNASRNGTWTNTFSSGNWDENSTRIKFTWDGTNNRYELHTYAQPKELSTQISGYNPFFYVKESSSSSSLANVTSYWSSTSQTLTAAGTGNKKSLVSSGTFHNDYLRFNSTDESGYTVLYFDESGVWYELEQTLKYDANGGTGSAPATVYYLKGTNATAAAANTFSRTGYTFDRWRTGASSGTYYAANVSVPMNSNITLYAQWNANQYTVTLDKQTGATGYGSGGTVSNPTVTFNAALPALSGTMPSGTGAYGFMGFYSKTGGAGTKFINADGTWAVTDVTDTISNGKWVKDGGITLYAYFKKAEITSLTLSAATVEPSITVTATPTISPTPTGTASICWKLLRSNGNLLSETFSSNSSTLGNSVTFTAPSASGTYKVAAVLRTGNACDAGTILDSVVTDLVVAGSHTVTIRYQDGDGRTLAASGSITGKPLVWSDPITAPTITGYTFARWEAGDGVYITDDNGTTTKTTTTTASIKVKASYDGNLTAVYTKKRMIYFNNTLGWGSVYVYFYKNDSYWQTVSPYNGSGANTSYTWTNTPYSEGKHGQMLPVSEGSNIYYFDAEAAGVPADYDDVVFTEHQQHGYNYFYQTKAARRGDYKSSLPMFVPLADQTADVHNQTNYYNHGYWMNYPENTGYTLKIYNAWDATKETDAVRSITFPYSADVIMPLKLDVEFNEANHDYWFMVYRNDGTYLGSSYHFKQGYQDEQTITGGNNKNKITTSAPGNYTLTLTYHDNGSGTVNYYIDVDFPVAVGDYRIVYKDNATWSNSAHGASWYHPSDVIVHIDGGATEDKKDIVSFYIAKGEGITTSMKFQYASAITDGGAITWTDVAGGTIDLSDFSSVITKAGVYNFHINQPTTGGIEVEKVEPYTGTYYIRTDCAGNTKWDSYTTLDHQMTYSDYAAAGTDGFTHYYCHWVTAGTNVKFTIANDYSVAISDSLEGDTYTNVSLGANANIRFMYDERTNIIKRAYISGSGTITDCFLVLEGDAKMYDENGNALTGANQDHDKYGNYLGTDNQVILHDDENFVYERTIKVNASARAKLTAKYNDKVQYFKGAEGAFADGTTVQLLGGTYVAANKYTMRIVYDFKTNRLVTAYMPEGEISGEVEINADMMLIREHQGEATQLTFASGSDKLTDVKSVYGVMRFNRWTLNNRQHPEDMDKDHSDTEAHITQYHPYVSAGSMKSISERGLYWISFPFDVNLSDVFGFGTYGTHWIMMEYNGAERARIGYWKDNEEGFWEYIWDRRGVTLKAGMGYVLALELDLMKYNDNSFWSNNIQQVELFFPSASTTTGEISQANVDVTVPAHLCTIDRTGNNGPDVNKNRTKADSHWNIIGVPSYANYGKTLTDGSSTVTWHSEPVAQNLPYLYEWNANDNTYTVQSGTKYPFKAMHAYYVQYAGTLHWSLASATPSSIAARRTYAETPRNAEFKLEIQQNEKKIDQTFVKLSDDEEASTNFVFGEDLNKEKNAGKANIYTLIENYLPVAGNTLPMTEQTTIVPVGVTIATAGEYTFAMPEGTSGIGVTLVDKETSERTNLGLMDYTTALEAGTHDGRFVLEISPIVETPTNIEDVTGYGEDTTGGRKVMIDGLLYIVKDGQVFDARGVRVK